MPAARGVKRTASKASASTEASSVPKNKKKRGVFQLEIPSIPTKTGRVYTCGMGDVGQLGLGEDIMETTKFKYVSSMGDNMVAVCAGGMHTVALDKDGVVWTFGCNDEGALGRPTSGDSEEGTPGTVTLPGKAVMISAGDSHTAALLENGDVYAWGSFRDSHGSMGLLMSGRSAAPSKTPIRLSVPETAARVASGSDHLAVLTTSGAVYTVGCGEQGQLGRLSQRSASRDARQGFSALLVPGKVTLKSPISAIWAGYHATFALDSSHTMLAWGLNNYSQLGITGTKNKTALYMPSTTSFPSGAWRHVACGQHHSIASDERGAAHALGRQEYGRLGLEREGDAETLELIPALKNHTCVSVACGTSNSFAVTDNGEIYAWGMGSEGQLGIGGSSDAARPSPAPLPAPLRARAVSAGGQHTCLLVEDPEKVNVTPPPAEKEPAEQKEEPVKVEEDSRKKRQNKRQKKDEEEVSSTSDQPQKVNGKDKDSAMEVDDTDNTQTEKPETKADEATAPSTDKQETDTAMETPEEPKETEPKPEDSKPETADVEMAETKDVKDVKETEPVNGAPDSDVSEKVTTEKASENVASEKVPSEKVTESSTPSEEAVKTA
ncbi:regulator of chromosome condensation [Plutella xylostella]|uniref:regulator of chromosome condensation n=1 Tax=Plutella xylostella TaxID=51655 RepID=UPI00203247CF|nr:regulator of chromosome condensation [Plutella xylostella]